MSDDRLAEIREKWRFTLDLPKGSEWAERDVKWLLTEVDRLDVAWTVAEERCFENDHTIARLASLLLSLLRFTALNAPSSSQDEPYFKQLTADITAALDEFKNG